MRIELNPNSIDDEIMGPDPARPPERSKKLTIGRRKPQVPSRPPSSLSGVSGFVSAPGPGSSLLSSPHRGPRRYLTINQDCSPRKPTIRNLLPPPSPSTKPVQQISRTQSPGKAQHQSLVSPMRPAATSHNVIREDFSPSPVVPKDARVSVARNVFGNYDHDILSSKTPVVNLPRLSKRELMKKGVKASKTVDISPDDDRRSISFQPTPARLKVIAGQRVAEKESQETDNEADTGRDEPLPPPPSDNTFKIPSVPMPGPPSGPSPFKVPPPPPILAKAKSDSNTGLVTETENASAEVRYLHSWVPRLKNGKLYVEGDLLDLDTSKDLSSDMTRRYLTSRIVRRVNNVTIGTKKTIYVLEGELLLRDFDTSKIGQTPFFILDKFKHGFPANWEKLVKHWVRMDSKNTKNSAYMSFISSTVLSNYSSLDNLSQANFSNVSAITTMNASGWVKQRMSNLSVNRQEDITVLPSVPEFEATLTPGKDEIIPHPVGTLEHEVQDAVTILEKQEQLAPIEEEIDDETSPDPEGFSHESCTDVNIENTKEFCKDCNMKIKYNYNRHYNSAAHKKRITEKGNKTEIVEVTEEKDGETSSSDEEDSSPEKNVKIRKNMNSLNLSKDEQKFCKDCNKKVTNYASHYNSALHKNIVSEKANKSKIAGLDGSFSLYDNYYCNDCNFSANSQRKMEEHCDLAIHKKKIREKIVKSEKSGGKRDKGMGCRGCGFSAFRTCDYAKHFTSQRHGRIEAQLRKERKLVKSHPEVPKIDSKVLNGKEAVEETRDERSKQKAKLKSRKKSSDEEENTETELDEPGEDLKRRPRDAVVKRKSDSPRKVSTKKVKKSHIEPEPVTVFPERESSVNQSMFGRQRKINRRYMRQSCVYNTPEEQPGPLKKSNKVKKTSSKDKENLSDEGRLMEREERDDVSSKKSKKAPKNSTINNYFMEKQKSSMDGENLSDEETMDDLPSKKTTMKAKKAKSGTDQKKLTVGEKSKKDDESLRKVVLNPFKKLSEEAVNKPAPKDVGDILKKVSAKPKTVKQRLQNVEALKEYNENHEDDMFNEPVPNSKSSMKLKLTSKSTLLSLDPDSDSDNDISVHSARTPVTAYFGKVSGVRDGDRTPGYLTQPDSPTMLPAAGGFQRQAYIQRTLAERNKDERLKKKRILTSTVSQVVSKDKKEKMVDQSTKVIRTASQQQVRQSCDDEEEEEQDDYFDEEMEDEASPENLVNLLRL